MAEFWNDCHIFCDVFSFSTCKRSSKTDSFSHSSKHFFSHDDSQPSPGQSESVSLCSAMSGIQHLTTKSTNFNTTLQHTNNRKKSQINNDACAWAQCATQAQVANCIQNVRRKCFSADVTFCNNGIPCNDNAFSIRRSSKRHIPQFCPQDYTVVTDRGLANRGSCLTFRSTDIESIAAGPIAEGMIYQQTHHRYNWLYNRLYSVNTVSQDTCLCEDDNDLCCCKLNGCRWKWQFVQSCFPLSERHLRLWRYDYSVVYRPILIAVLLSWTSWFILFSSSTTRQIPVPPLVPLAFYSAPDRGADDCDERVWLCVYVFFVCQSAIIISSELHVRWSPNLLFMLLTAVARSCAGGIMIRYVLPVYGWRHFCS